jgi:hypothetical protein
LAKYLAINSWASVLQKLATTTPFLRSYSARQEAQALLQQAQGFGAMKAQNLTQKIAQKEKLTKSRCRNFRPRCCDQKAKGDQKPRTTEFKKRPATVGTSFTVRNLIAK